MDDRFLNGIIGAEVRVCGQTLTNLTPWHYVLLNAIKSPIVYKGRKPTPVDILQFLRIVNVSYPETPDLRPRLIYAFLLLRLKSKNYLINTVTAIADWLKVQLSVPKLWDNEQQSGSSLSSPALFALVVELVVKGKLGLQQAWDMRIAEARWFDTTMAEILGGSLKIVDETEEQPEFKNWKEAEIIEAAREQLTKQEFKAWIKARKRNQKGAR